MEQERLERLGLSTMKMGTWKGWRCFKRFSISSTKIMLLKIRSHFGYKPRGHKKGLMTLFKEMESCGEYEDIQVMWKMILSSSRQYA